MANSPTFEEKEHLKLEMEEIEPEHKRLKCSIEQLKQELLERRMKLKEELIALQEENKRLDEQRKQKEQKLQRYILNTSIEGIWENDDNTNFVIDKYGGSLVNSQVNPQSLPASAVEVDFPLVAPLLDSKILRTASSLLAAFKRVDKHGCRVQTYGNEADVRGSVHSALMDALKILNGLHGGENLLTAGHESWIFSNRPDHLVVRVGTLQTPIFVVETKTPVDKIDDYVWGKIYDYHGIMRVLGHCNPFVMLSTFEQSWITWEESNQTCAEIAATTDDGVRFKPLQEVKELVARRPSSGTPLQRHETADVVQNRCTATTSQKPDRTERRLYRSKPCKSNHLVKLLVNAIACSLSNFHGSASIVRNDQGYQLTDKPVLTLTQHEYSFETISLQVMPGEFQSSNFAQPAKNGFHILDILGSGRTSKVFLATTTRGHECVIKMYVAEFELMDANEFKREAKISTAKETRMYKLIYDMTIPIIELFKYMCLILPYFRPIQEDERDDALEDLGELLRQKFRVRKRHSTIYYKFSEDDQSWRHCGYMCKNQEKTFMVFDLADLETCETEEEHDRYIESHIDKLRGGNSCSSS